MKTHRLAASAMSILLISGGLTVLATPAAAETPNVTAADRAPCKDPWINYAYRTQWNRSPVGLGGAGECNIYLYAAGRWNSYDQLRNAVNRFVRNTQNSGMSMQSVGGAFQMINRATGGRAANVVIRIIDNSGVGKMFDLMGNALKTFGLMSADKQVDLGDGSSLVVR